ncbi:MAG TPA: hypothetical protein VIN67_03470, partial [Desulfobaccales bacterium]
MAALLTWLFLAGPAVAGLKSFTDSQGVIHISNVKPRPTPAQADRLPAAPDPSALVSPPQTAADPVAPTVIQPPKAAPVDLQAAVEATQKVCRNLADNQIRPPAQAIDQIIAAAGLAAAARPNEVAAPQVPRHQAAHEATAGRSSWPPAPQPEARKKKELVTAGGIRRYQDAKGVWHISNVAPVDDATDSMMLAAAKPSPSGNKAYAENPPGPPAVASSPSPLIKVAWHPDDHGGSSLPTMLARARTGDPGGPSTIRRYRDAKGVIHISNVAEALESLPAVGLQARAGPEKVGGPPIRGHPSSPALGLEDRWALKTVAFSGEGPLPLRRAKTAASPKAQIVTEGGIRRWRDKQGVWH